MQKCIVVLGMHRSGTSAFTGVLNLLGIKLGSSIMSPTENNPKGFFENDNVVQINEKILKSLNSSWDDLFLLPENWWKQEGLKKYRKKIIELIEKEFTDDMFAIKDPRISRLLPFWSNIFEELEIQPYCIITLRNPLEVAYSLKKRDDFSLEKSSLLWLNHMLDAEFYSRNYTRGFISFDELLGNPEKTITTISKSLEIDFPRSYHDAKPDIEQFLEPTLKHHVFKMDKADNVSLQFINDYYLLLNSYLGKKINNYEISKIDAIKEEFLRLQSLFYNKDMKDIKDAKEKKNQELKAIYSSNFWKVANRYYMLRDTILSIWTKR